MSKNKLTDLNDHLFAQLERLSDEDLKGEALVQEIQRSEAVTKVSQVIVSNAGLVLKAQIAASNSISGNMQPPAMLGIGGE